MELSGIRLRNIFRNLTHAPTFTLIAIATIAIGIGANTAAFSVIHSVLLKPLAYPESDRLVGVWETAPGLSIKQLNAAPSLYYVFREENRVFEEIGIFNNGSVSVTGLAEPEQVRVIEVTDGVGRVLGVAPLMGRWFTREDDSPGQPETVILSYGYWRQRLGGNPNVLGRKVTVNGRPMAVVGVMPESFRFLDRRFSLLLPHQFDRSKLFVGNFSYQAVARLKPGVTLAAANADVARMLPMLTQKFPPAPGMSPKAIEEARLGPDVHPLGDDVIGDVGNVLWILMGTLGFVLLIACANVANLLLVRADGKQQELAVRAALGASRWQLAAGLLAESLTLGVLGGLLGVVLAMGSVRLLRALAPSGFPRLDEIVVDAPVLAFALALSVVAGLVFGAIPALKYATPKLGTSLREGGRALSESRGRQQVRGALVVVQVMLALVLVVSSGLMVRSFLAMQRVEPGFTRPEGLLTLRVSIPNSQVKEEESVVRMQERIMRNLEAIPGVQAVSAGNSVTMDGNQSNDPIFAEDRTYRDGEIPAIRRFKFVHPGYFRTLGNRLVAGRDLAWEDVYGQRPVVLVSENLARELWRQPAAALGKRVRESPGGLWREVIGVVGNEHDNGIAEKAPEIVYWPVLAQSIWGEKIQVQRGLVYVIRGPVQAPGFLAQVQRAVWQVNANLPLADVRTMAEVQRRSMARAQFTLVMLAIAGAMALLLGVVGIYGVIAYAVSQRTREMGIRLALGAQAGDVRGLFLRQGLWLCGIGVVCGLCAAAALTRLMTSLLYGVSPLDPVTFTAAAGTLTAAALLASYLPARRASRVDPALALRAE